LKLESISRGAILTGVDPAGPVTVMAVDGMGTDAVTVIFKGADGRPAERMLFRSDEPSIEPATITRPWSFGASAKDFKLAAEAQRIKLAHLFDPMMAVHTSSTTHCTREAQGHLRTQRASREHHVAGVAVCDQRRNGLGGGAQAAAALHPCFLHRSIRALGRTAARQGIGSVRSAACSSGDPRARSPDRGHAYTGVARLSPDLFREDRCAAGRPIISTHSRIDFEGLGSTCEFALCQKAVRPFGLRVATVSALRPLPMEEPLAARRALHPFA